jgi:hypothetical protein
MLDYCAISILGFATTGVVVLNVLFQFLLNLIFKLKIVFALFLLLRHIFRNFFTYPILAVNMTATEIFFHLLDIIFIYYLFSYFLFQI